MKKKINVIDLDKTLIPYDSFEKLVKIQIRNLNLKVIYYTAFRVLRFISLEDYKKKITNLIKLKFDNDYFENFATRLFDDIDKNVLEKINIESESTSINILLSASPNIYVKYLVKKMKWVGTGSYFDENKTFIHLHGKGKIIWIHNNYPPEEYQYHFAISDSCTDDNLLKLFKINIKWILPLKNMKNYFKF